MSQPLQPTPANQPSQDPADPANQPVQPTNLESGQKVGPEQESMRYDYYPEDFLFLSKCSGWNACHFEFCSSVEQEAVQDPPQDQQKIQEKQNDAVAEKKDKQNEPEEENIDSRPRPELPEPSEENHDDKEEKDNEEGEDEEERGKSMRKGSSDSIRESHQDNDTSQPLAGGGKKCFNKLCSSKKIYKKIRSKVEPQRYRFLCRSCYQNYVNNSFCQFCEQIYSNYENEEQDLNKWVGCDKCQRWNHIECERKYRDKSFEMSSSTHYECLACSRKNGAKNIIPQTEAKRTFNPSAKLQDRVNEYDLGRATRKIEISKEDRMPIFFKKAESFPCLEAFLQSYNFRVWITENMVREDIESLRSLSRRPPMEDEPKKMKKVKPE